MQLGEPPKFETQAGADTRRLPVGCYDTVDSFYDPKRLSICALDTFEPVRMPSAEEKQFIISNCRVQK